jgi:hypothetical protein
VVCLGFFMQLFLEGSDGRLPLVEFTMHDPQRYPQSWSELLGIVGCVLSAKGLINNDCAALSHIWSGVHMRCCTAGVCTVLAPSPP